MEFIKNIKQIILYGLIPLININIIFSSSENSEVVTLDKLPLLNVSEENNIINNNDNNNELDSGKDFEGLSEDILKNINKDSEIKEMTQKNNLQILNILEKRKIIYDHVIGTFHKEDERSYLKNKKLATDIIYERLFYNCCFFLTINMPRWLYILGNVFCWFSLFVSSFLCGLSVSMVYTNKNDGTVDKQDKELFPIYTAIILFITIINGFIGYKYGASGYGLFLNMILYPTVAYIIPIIQSFVFFVFPRESYFSENIKLYISTTIANILVLILMGIRLINLFFVSINQKKIKFIETLIKDYITKYSLDYVFTSINFNIVYLMLVFYFLVCFVSILGIVKVVYLCFYLGKFADNKPLQESKD